MKVKFLKDHLDHKKGDSIDVDEARADYWQNVGVAEPTKSKKQDEGLKETVVILEQVSNVDVNEDGIIGDPEKVKMQTEPVKEKNEGAGPNRKKKKK